VSDREWWSRVDALFEEALEQPSDHRTRWVDDACGDDARLKRELNRLLSLADSDTDTLRPGGALDGPLGEELAEELEASEPGALRPGDRVGPYEILGLLGRGGMGRVYRARDPALEREVAVKALADAFVGDPSGLKRFEREAKVLAALNHPNITGIYDLLEVRGTTFLILELVEGETLGEQLVRGPVRLDRVLRITAQLVDALEEAHDKGVVHRDLKPSNVKLTATGRVKVLDFGLAKPRAASGPRSGSDVSTRSGMVIGTPPYMSPEQARGNEVDERTDIWTLGCLVYEMLTGRRAFPGSNASDVLAAVLRDEADYSRLPGDTPPQLRKLIQRCLQKDPARRPQSAAEVRALLSELVSGPWPSVPTALMRPPRSAASWRWAAAAGGALLVAVAAVIGWPPGRPTPAPEKVKLAVLPFRNLSLEPDLDYLSEGFTEEMITQLGRVRPSQLGVIARQSAMRYKGSDRNLGEIAGELGVDYVVDGSLRREGEVLRITAHLIRAEDEATLWSSSYDRTLGGVLTLQSEVAEAIARHIRVAVAPRAAPRANVAPEAYESYLRARFHHHQATVLGLRRAAEHYRKAAEQDPEYALAHAGLAQALIFVPGVSPRAALDEARSAAARAAALDPDAPETQTALALTRLYADWDWSGALAAIERAVSLDPGNADAHYYYAHCLAATGRIREALDEAARAQEADPLSALLRHYTGRLWYFARDYERAIQENVRALDLDPNYFWAHLFIAVGHQALGRSDKALESRLRADALMGADPSRLQEQRELFAADGYPAVLRLRAEAVERRAEELGYVTSGELALIYSELGEVERALDWLERALEDHTRDMIYVDVEPRYAELRGHPRFEAIRRRTNRAPAPGAGWEESGPGTR
jgi:serine/threonine protein kinase/tetratricopeptide (TPR) repeat protein